MKESLKSLITSIKTTLEQINSKLDVLEVEMAANCNQTAKITDKLVVS